MFCSQMARVRVLVVVFATVVSAGFAVAAAAHDVRDVRERQAGERGQRQPAAARALRGVGREVASLRTRTSKTFATRGGGLVARVSTGSVHFRNRRGQWQQIDNRLRRQGGRLLNGANRYSTSLPLDLGRDSVRVRRGRLGVGFRLRGARGQAQPRGADVLYRDAFPGVDALYGARSDSVKESFVLRRRATRRQFVFDLEMTRGLRPSLLRSGALVFRDRRDRARFAVAAPFMRDARGRASSRVRFGVANVRGRWRLTLTASDAWLDAPARAYPVVVDPWVWVDRDGDCTLDQATPDTSYCGQEFLDAGYGHGGEHHAALRFRVNEAVPPGADVQHAHVALRLAGRENDNAATLGAFPLNEAFTGAATWRTSDG